MESTPFKNSSDFPQEEQTYLRHKESERLVPASDFENAKNTVEISTENAEYKIIYSVHGRQNDPGDVEGSDAIMLEFMPENFEEDRVAKIIKDQTEQQQQYAEVVKYATSHNVPLYFIDLSWKTSSEKDPKDVIRAMKKYVAPVVGLKIGYEVVKSAAKNMKNKPVTKRDFLSAFGKTLVASYFSTPAADVVTALASTQLATHEPDETTMIRTLERNVRDVNDKLHPELRHFSLEGRNTLMAEKAELVAKTLNKGGKKPKISIIIGARHTSIEDNLKMPEGVRREELRKYFTSEEIEGEKTIAKVDFKKSEGSESGEQKAEISFLEVNM